MNTDHVLIIAEAGVNHNGSVQMALELVDVAHAAGVDAVKFQTFKSESVVSQSAPKAEYQQASTGTTESQLDMVRKLELSADDHKKIVRHCESLGLRFLSTPFDAQSADFLVHELNVPLLKIPSGEITNLPFLLHIARLQRPVILSTGMSNLGEVEQALGALAFGYLGTPGAAGVEAFLDAYCSPAGQEILQRNVSLLHCTTEYPAPFDQVNLRAMDTLASAFGLPTGLSDHTPGYAIPLAGAARGARIVEKHFTLDRSLPGPDHMASIEPADLKAMVSGIRQIEQALGGAKKHATAVEVKNRGIARRSLVAARPVRAGEVWTADNLVCKRPGYGLPPSAFWSLLGRRAWRDFNADEAVDTAGE